MLVGMPVILTHQTQLNWSFLFAFPRTFPRRFTFAAASNLGVRISADIRTIITNSIKRSISPFYRFKFKKKRSFPKQQKCKFALSPFNCVSIIPSCWSYRGGGYSSNLDLLDLLPTRSGRLELAVCWRVLFLDKHCLLNTLLTAGFSKQPTSYLKTESDAHPAPVTLAALLIALSIKLIALGEYR